MGIPVPGGLGTDVKAGFDPLPNGVYVAEVTDGEERKAGQDAKNPGSTYIAWEFTIQDEEYEGRKAWTNTSFTEKARPILKGFLMAVGYTEEEVASDDFEVEIDDIIGRQCRIVLKVGENPKTKEANNSVKRVLPLDDGAESDLP